jgi:hypothetical protein
VLLLHVLLPLLLNLDLQVFKFLLFFLDFLDFLVDYGLGCLELPRVGAHRIEYTTQLLFLISGARSEDTLRRCDRASLARYG